jgi:hypothetical protein
LENKVACEELEANFENMMDAFDQAVAFREQAEADLQQAQWAEMAAMGAAMMAWWMLEECLNNQGGGMRVMQDAFSSPEKLKAKISEFRALRKNKK